MRQGEGVAALTELNLYQLRIFYSVARHLNYSRAGEELALSQPAVSRQVAALEKSLELELFVQRGRQVELTDVGRLLFEYADGIFELVGQAERAMSQFKDLECGQVLIGAGTTIGSYILPPMLQEFSQRHPKINTSLRLGNSAAIEQLVSDRKIDLGVVGGQVKNPGLHVEPCLRDDLVMIIAPDHALQNKKEVLIEDLAKEIIIVREEGSAARALVEQYLAEKQIVFRRKMEIGDTEAIKRLVAARMGVAFVPRYAITLELSAGILAVANGGNFQIPMFFSVISAKDQHYYPTVLAFLNFIRKWLPAGGC